MDPDYLGWLRAEFGLFGGRMFFCGGRSCIIVVRSDRVEVESFAVIGYMFYEYIEKRMPAYSFISFMEI